MTFGMTLAEHLTMAASTGMFYIAIDYENELNMKVAASNVNIKMHQLFSNQQILGDHCTVENRRGLDTNWLLNNVYTILEITIKKLILICLSNSFFSFFIKMKNEKRTVFCFPFSYEHEKRMKLLKIQRKNILNMKIVVNYLNFVFLFKVKAKSKYRILNFVFQSIKNTKWHFGYTD